jgi:hypothetical protein
MTRPCSWLTWSLEEKSLSSPGFLKRILSAFAESLQPLRDGLASREAFAEFLNQFGWSLGPTDLTNVMGSLGKLSTLATDPSSLNLEQLVGELVSVGKAIRTIANSGAPTAFATTFPRELLDFLFYSAVVQKCPPLFGILHFAGVLNTRRVPKDAATGRAEHIERQVHWERLGPLADQPLDTIKQSYGWGETFDGNAFLRSLGILVRGFGGYAGLYLTDHRLVDQYYARGAPEAAGRENLILSVPALKTLATSGSASANTKLAFLVIPIPPSPGAAAPPDGLALMPMITGKASDSFAISENVSLKLSGDFLTRPIRAEIHPHRAVVRGSVGDSHVDALARLDAKRSANAPWIPIGDPRSSRLEISAVHASLGMSGELDGDVDLQVEVGVDAATLVIDFSEGDSFLQQTVSSQPTRSKLSFVIKWSSKSGFSLGGQPKLRLSLPISQSLGGVASLEKIDITLGAGSGKSIELDLTLTGSTSIGPLTAILDDVGLRIGLASLDDTVPPGSLGNLDLQFGFKPPTGVGLKIDSPVVTGGGFLLYDTERAQYGGIVQLEFTECDLSLKAIGLISTRLPGGAKGFSMIVIITAAGFRPIPLGLGFTLTAIGGMVAINRTFNEDAVRAGIKSHALERVLFPQDPIGHAAQLISSLNNFFPAQKDSYLLGVLVQIEWGLSSPLKMQLGLILELGRRTRFIVLGHITLTLPREDHDLVRLNMDAVGVLDFDQHTAAVDAALYDSRLLKKFVLTGQMAMRLRWGSSPQFALSVGGFHPAFKPPAGFPRLERIALSLSDSDHFRLRCEGYFALTSNTLQFGARAELMARAGGCSIQGEIGFDALIQFDPFMFVAGFHASVQFKIGSRSLGSVSVKGELSGPRPLHIKGKASFSIFWCTFSVRFNKTLLSGEPPPRLEPVKVMERLTAALADARNWGGQLPEGDGQLVTLRERQLPKDVALQEVALHPLGKLSVKQSVVPLELEIAKFGPATPADGNFFQIKSVSVDGKSVDLDRVSEFERVTDFFAPAEFLEMTDDEKLTAPSFEPLTAGFKLNSDTFILPELDSDLIEEPAISYETIIISDKKQPALKAATLTALDAAQLAKQLRFGAAGRSDVRRTGATKFSTGGVKNVLTKTGWVVVSAADRTRQSAPGIESGKLVSYAEAFQALQQLKRENPALARSLKIARSSESVN